MARHAKRNKEPTDVRLASDIQSLLNSGTWRDDPWFLRDPAGLSSSNGHGTYSRAQLERAADALAAVYTPEACREIFANPGRGPFVGILFMLANRERIFPFVRLGLDLADIGGPLKFCSIGYAMGPSSRERDSRRSCGPLSSARART